VHIFFLFIIAYQGVALCIMLTQAFIYDRLNNDSETPPIVMQLDYVIIVGDCVFNVFVLYYFVSISRRNQGFESRIRKMEGVDNQLITQAMN
jgi:hypothetical protein